MGRIRKNATITDINEYAGRSKFASRDASYKAHPAGGAHSDRPFDWEQDAPELAPTEADPTPPHGIMRPSRPTGAGKIVVNVQHDIGSDGASTIENTLRNGY